MQGFTVGSYVAQANQQPGQFKVYSQKDPTTTTGTREPIRQGMANDDSSNYWKPLKR